MKRILWVSMLAIAGNANAQVLHDLSAPMPPAAYEVQTPNILGMQFSQVAMQAACTDGYGYINRECASRFEITSIQKVTNGQIHALQELAETDAAIRNALNNAGIGASK